MHWLRLWNGHPFMARKESASSLADSLSVPLRYFLVFDSVANSAGSHSQIFSLSKAAIWPKLRKKSLNRLHKPRKGRSSVWLVERCSSCMVGVVLYKISSWSRKMIWRKWSVFLAEKEHLSTSLLRSCFVTEKKLVVLVTCDVWRFSKR